MVPTSAPLPSTTIRKPPVGTPNPGANRDPVPLRQDPPKPASVLVRMYDLRRSLRESAAIARGVIRG